MASVIYASGKNGKAEATFKLVDCFDALLDALVDPLRFEVGLLQGVLLEVVVAEQVQVVHQTLKHNTL